MSRKVIIHIGMHKTGTSSIQRNLYKKLQDPYFEYLKLDKLPHWMPKDNHSVIIVSLFAKNPEEFHFFKNRGITSIQIQKINEIIKQEMKEKFVSLKKPNLIISGESITILNEEALSNFRNFLGNYFSEIIVVGYVRSPKTYMESMFSTVLKEEQRFSFDKINSLYPKYRKTFEKFDTVFGKEYVNLWVYDIKKFVQNDVVLDFCRKVGITKPPIELDRINESLSKDALSYMYIYSKFGKSFPLNLEGKKERSLFIKELMKLKGPKFRFSSLLVDPIIDRFINDLKWIKRRVNFDILSLDEKSLSGILTETDLLSVGEDAIKWLSERINKKINSKDPQSIAEALHNLRMRLRNEYLV